MRWVELAGKDEESNGVGDSIALFMASKGI
jgi:hypothetical protein